MTEKTRERLALEYEVADLISRLSVHMHYRASAQAARRRLYAVFEKAALHAGQAHMLTEPTSHAQAQADLRRIVAERICDLFEARKAQ